MMQSETINELAAALAKAQGSMQNATMNRTNPHFKSKYADLSSVLDATRAPLSANGLSVVQTMQTGERGMVLRTMLMHSSGQYIATEYPLPVAQRPHEMGSALTYARRYSYAALVCNSADEDDDGNVAMATPPKPNGPIPNGEKRQNPHVTRPEDIFDPSADQDIEPQSLDATSLPKAKAKALFTELQESVWKCGSVEEMKAWNETNKPKLDILPNDWFLMLKGVYVEHKAELLKLQAGDEQRVA